MASRGRGVTFERLEPPTTIHLTNVHVMYEPSVYGGDGTETRRNIVFSGTPPEVLQGVKVLEAPLDPTRLCSCIKGVDALKCKINMDKVRVYNAQGTLIDMPDTWRGLDVNAIATIKGTWVTKAKTGLSVEVQYIQVTEAIQSAPPTCPFGAVMAA